MATSYPSVLRHPLILLISARLAPLIDMIHLTLLGLPFFVRESWRRPKEVWSSRETVRRTFFAGVWELMSEEMDKGYEPYKRPLLQDVKGVVVDLGSGRGENLRYLNPSLISLLILIEPNELMHPILISNATKVGFLSEQLRVLPIGAEEFDKFDQATGLGEESVDAVISVLALCGVPEPRETIDGLYKKLKKGGKFIFFEHVRSTDASTARYQKRIQPLWSCIFDNCMLDRPTDEWITEDHKWDSLEVETVPGVQKYDIFPKRMGWAQK